METNIIIGSIISTTVVWLSATQAETEFFQTTEKKVGNVIVTFSEDCTVTTYNTEVIIVDEIDKHHSGI